MSSENPEGFTVPFKVCQGGGNFARAGADDMGIRVSLFGQFNCLDKLLYTNIKKT